MHGIAQPQPALVIGGPTASGKTRVAIEIAKRCNGEIINADAFQLYRGLPILTAQPDDTERAGVPHHLLGEFPLEETFDVARYLELARASIARVLSAKRLPILVGGTGFYIRAVLQGLAEGLPGADPELRATLEALPLSELQDRLRALDPAAFAAVDLQNTRRVLRAVEVCILTGKPFSSFKPAPLDHAAPRGIWISHPRDALHGRIAERTRAMFNQGVEEEVRAALPQLGKTSRQAIGIDELQRLFLGLAGREETIRKIVEATRQYARRQETWFRKEAVLRPVEPAGALAAALEILR